jgi:hypothetical protein
VLKFCPLKATYTNVSDIAEYLYHTPRWVSSTSQAKFEKAGTAKAELSSRKSVPGPSMRRLVAPKHNKLAGGAGDSNRMLKAPAKSKESFRNEKVVFHARFGMKVDHSI